VGHGAGLDNVESNPDPLVMQYVTGARATNQIKFSRQGPVLAPFFSIRPHQTHFSTAGDGTY
jgi:hypothetical protein